MNALLEKTPKTRFSNSDFKMLHQSSYENTIARIRSQVYEHRINLSELFHDFDKLRSGTVQINQFKRCIALIMDRAANPLNEQDYATLAAKHGITVDGAHLARWCEFQKTIDKVFHDETTRLKHHKPKNNTPEFTSVIKTLNEYTKNHGSDVKTFFSDFDKQNSGFITTSQFRRGLPANLLTAEQQDILYSVFYDTDRKTFNYFKLDRQVQRSKHQIEAPQQKKLEKITKSANVDLVPIGTEELLCPKQKHELSVDEILNETRKFVYKNRIRVVDFFRDFDKHNSGLVTKHQFLSGLDNAKFIATENLCEYYKTDKGINYRLFCADIESVFTTVGLCHDPLINISKPSIEYLVDGVNKLSVQDEAQCQEIITHLKGIVAEKRTLLAPYFKDFDRNHLGNMGNVTKSHFSRLLSSLKLEVSDANLKILFKKFENKNDRINYMAFIHAIDASSIFY